MMIATELKSLKDILEEYNKIIIPDVQRDYVMGSGGEKLTKLLDAMKNNGEFLSFNFSCLVGYADVDEDNQKKDLYIYDGQQRLVTLVCLCAYLNAELSTDVSKLLGKFIFTDRVVANEWLEKPVLINEIDAVDFTTYSMAQLTKIFDLNYKDKITFDFLFNKVEFNTILVKEIGDAEQFFLDINDGLQLESYELYKAELFHHMLNGLEEDDNWNEDDFTRFALKLENQWLNFFSNYKDNKDYCEEQLLVLFLQYCTRMIWISEKGNSNDYDFNEVSWLNSSHLLQIEQIVDAIVAEIDQHDVAKINCLDSSFLDRYEHFSFNKKMHWSLQDTNYNDMLKLFLRNLDSKEEINKDVIIWCYITNLPFYNASKTILNAYLRFIKKILNNNRYVNKKGNIKHLGNGIGQKVLYYYRYCVKAIPVYYEPIISHTESESEIETKYLINEIIELNKAYIANNFPNFIDIYLSLCKSDDLKLILKREKMKEKSIDFHLIHKYENLPFINGLVDNLLEYSDEYCCLKDIYKGEMYNKISKEQFWSGRRPSSWSPCWEIKTYKNILKFIYEYNINLYDILFSDVRIEWTKYTGYSDSTGSSPVSVLPHTWYDLFTSKNRIVIQNDSSNPIIKDLPDGWFVGYQIKQPQNTQVEGKTGFVAGKVSPPPITVWDMNHFSKNFSWIYGSEKGKYIVNGTEQEWLPDNLNCYTESWIEEQLAKKKKTFFSSDVHLNKILLNKWRNLSLEKGTKFSDKAGKVMTFDTYVKLCPIWYVKLDDDYFFIEIHTIE